MVMILVPLGSACRVAFQVRTYLESNGMTASSYPFDWAITPWKALKFILSDGFNVSHSLLRKNLKPCMGSFMDDYTGMIHYHDFMPESVANASDESINILLNTAKKRLEHTLCNLLLLRRYKNRIGFIRWMRRGVPDKEIPDLFTGESPVLLFDLLANFLKSENFALLSVTTWVTDYELGPDDILNKYKKSGDVIFEATIKERKGYNGNMTNDYRGDTCSWKVCLDKFINDANISLSSSLV